MRISTQQLQDRALSAILQSQSNVSKTQQQLATGKEILVPSDDVIGTTQILALNKIISTNEQFNDNANVAESKLAFEESSLTHSIDLLQRLNELAIQSTSVILTAQNKANLAIEVRVILDSFIGIANEKNSNGGYMFSGFNVKTQPFTITENPPASGLFDYSYTGDLGQQKIQIGETRFINVGDNGQDVFMDVPLSGGGTQSIFETLEQFAVALEANTSTATVADDLKAAMQHLSTFRTYTGARLNAIETHRQLNSDIVFQGQRTLSQIQDVDYAEAISRLNLQLVELEAAQQSFIRIQNLSLFNFL